MNTSKPYHHGNLHEAILHEAITLGREGGPQAVTIRAATRAVGVSPTAAYRHFKDQAELLDAVANASTAELIERLSAAFQDTEGTIVDKMMAAGFAYYHYALDEPDFFECMMASRGYDIPGGLATATDGPNEDPRVQAAHNFYCYMEQYARECGQVPDRKHMMRNCLAGWSTVHGFTVLCTSGHLASLSDEQREEMAKAVFASAIRGLDFENSSDPHRYCKKA
ncbi:TetR/AcrR family transcriptional regulator [Corynebacterium minutissimum]|uniref:TetR family transcriptional regulator n=1 Tax=Corynebacterium minutissimum TaxID=38301 RepID=A0A376D1H5_9CORY|nr:TetR/AcrR family transcriptional regulator [Corynebacterium minutissimum]QRP61310.1 TetR/AcrR family transcriptional regulator [Corynebacterium minutissimum]STC79268.1 TetR family transcriptional regulator [Corynebacterium minutissimum]